ncbi:hypothetical protein ACFCV8_00635, partial [Streptomyces sp. NPDC056347]|uniref:phage tail protein n=1 Tax=Streptomyces sp. NPDC056347 TaxID=3345790 RepID=UPI0035E2F43B
MSPDQPPPNPGAPPAADAVPDKQPPAVTDFSQGPAANDQAMADAEVTEDQLAKGNEPEFDQALSAKKTAETDSAKAPAKGRAAEAQQLTTAKAGAAASGAQALSTLTATRATAGKHVDSGKGETKSKDEKRRAEATAKLQKVYDSTKKDVETTLTDLDKKVDTAFTTGEKAARDAFTADHKRRMKAYKDKRYSGMFGGAKWAKDKLMGMPEEANQLFQEARKLYVAKMQTVISSVADVIGTELGKAKARIAKGRAELKTEVDKLPADLKQFGQDAATDFAGKFDDLEATVNEKSEQLVQDLANKYTAALNKIDEEIKKLQEANKGLVQKAKEAIVGVIKTVKELTSLLLNILAKAASAVMKIIKDPIGFLGNLVKAVGAGLHLFINNIADHLKTGLVSWLLGTAVKAGLELPQRFDLKGIIQLIGALLGLTWANIRTRITQKGIPEQALTTIETSVPVAKKLATEGPAGAVNEITQEAGDLKATILEKLTTYLIPTVLIAGITWIISLLNPASAFIRAVKGIIDIVTFIVNQGAQIVDFVNAVLDAVIAITNGGAAGVPKMVETALATSIPLLIGFLASLLGISGLANKVKSVFHAVSKPVNRAIDKIINLIARKGKVLWNKLKGKGKNGDTKNKKGEGKTAEFSWSPPKVLPRSIKKPFSMTSGEPHTLTAKTTDSGLRVIIASAFAGEVRSVMRKVKEEAEKLPETERKEALEAISGVESTLAKLSDAEAKWKRNKRSAEKTVANRIKKRIEKNKIKTQAEADRLSKQWLEEKEQKLYQPLEQMLAKQIISLSKLKSMQQFVTPTGTRRLPPGYDVRTRLYVLGSGWKTKSNSWRKKEKETLVEDVTNILKNGYNPAARTSLEDLDQRYKLPNNALDLFDKKELKATHIKNTEYDVDHHPIPLAQHWKSDGHKQDDTARRDHNVEKNNWRLITRSWNRRLQAGGHQYGQQRDLGTSFTSEIADGGIPNAKRIDGRPLLDENERPIP